MIQGVIGRRTLLNGAGPARLSATVGAPESLAQQRAAVPNSTGAEAPVLKPVPDELIRRRVLVDNPQTLYGFAKAG